MNMFINRLEDVTHGEIGTVTRSDNLQIDAVFMNDPNAIVSIGRAVKLNAQGKAEYLTNTSDITNGMLWGFTVRVYPTNTYKDTVNNTNGRKADQAIDVLRRGYMLVKCVNGTPKKGGKVYLYHTADSDKKVGDISATMVTDKTTELKGVTFASSNIDKNKVTEIVII